MDEEQGIKSYDIVKRQKLYFCGAAFDAQRPNVHTSGMTNEDGYYRIESASYGTGTTFLAKPMKDFLCTGLCGSYATKWTTTHFPTFP
ncbi:MAG: hypothetical protein IPL65_16380 [Lewinellaceae bacterium]|nr:hypothetical protein [Lewinellaceae bacterium]